MLFFFFSLRLFSYFTKNLNLNSRLFSIEFDEGIEFSSFSFCSFQLLLSIEERIKIEEVVKLLRVRKQWRERARS